MIETDGPYRRLTPTPLWNTAVEQIKELIDCGDIEIGTRLPAERELCQKLGISRVSLRESLRVLQSIGYVETRPGSGTYARKPEPIAEGAALAEWLEQDIQIIELFELRAIVEPGIAALSAKRRTNEHLHLLGNTIATMSSATEDDYFHAIAADAAFHQIIADSASNTALIQLVDKMHVASGHERQASLQVPGQIDRAIQDHQQILDAIKMGDSESARIAMQQHLSRAVAEIGAFAENKRRTENK